MTKRLPPEIKNQRKPTRVACTFCSQKHLQCDESRPCKNCTKKGFADSCKDAVRKKKRVNAAVTGSKSAARDKVSDRVPKPRGRPRKGPLPPNKIQLLQNDADGVNGARNAPTAKVLNMPPLIKPKPKNGPEHNQRQPQLPKRGLLSLVQASTMHQASTPSDLKPVDSFSNLQNTGLSNLALPNLNSLPSFITTPKANASFSPLPAQSPLNINSHNDNEKAEHQAQIQNLNYNNIPSFTDLRLNSSFWDVKSVATPYMIPVPPSKQDLPANSDNSNSRNLSTKSPSQLFIEAPKLNNNSISSHRSSTTLNNDSKKKQIKILSSTSLVNLLNPQSSTRSASAVTSNGNNDINNRGDSPSSDEAEAPLEFKASSSIQTSRSFSHSPKNTPAKSSSKTPQKFSSATRQGFSNNDNSTNHNEDYAKLNEFLQTNPSTPNEPPFTNKKDKNDNSSNKNNNNSNNNDNNNNNIQSSNGSSLNNSIYNFNAGYAQQMNYEMDALNFPNSSVLINADEEDTRPFIEINLEDGTMISSYSNNGTPNAFVFNPNHSQMPNTASEISSNVEQTDEYTSPLIMRHVIKHPDDIYLTSIVKSYQYPLAYHALIAYLKRRFNKLQLLEIAKCMAKYRPSFISATKSLYENDLIFTERSFQRTLLEYEHLISMSPSPTIIWRRTGEIVALTNAFCVMTGYSKMSLLSKRTYIVELMDDESTIKYFRSFSDLAFGDLNATFLTDCNLRKANDNDYLRCCCVWTIKRDAFDIPMLIVGQFLPVLE